MSTSPSPSVPGRTRTIWPTGCRNSGWENVTYRNLTGGIVAVHRATKPLESTAASTPDGAAAAIAAHKGPVAKLRRNITR